MYNVYVRTQNVRFPIVIKVDNEDNIISKVNANKIDKEEELFLCGRKTLPEWKIAVLFEENR